MQIIMTPDEVKLLSSFLKESDNYFEFGMGGSTILANSLVKKSITSVESDKEWVQKVADNLKESTLDLDLRYVNIGPTGGWGTPVNRNSEDLFPSYPRSLRKATNKNIDFCLVDGRFRVACFLTALDCLSADSIIAIHDYSVRPNYHLVEEFARKVASTHTLALFVRRQDANLSRVRQLIAQYEKNYD